MSKLSIFETAWIDLVFEGKNKAYGAYQLRKENPKTTIKALLIGLLFVSGLLSLPFFLSSFSDAETVISDPVYELPDATTIVEYKRPEEPKKAEPATPAAPEKQNPVWNDHPEVTSTQNATPEVDPNIGATPSAPAENGVPGGVPSTNPPTTGGGIPGTGDNNTPVISGLLDKLPEYPGGMKNFYKYIEKNFKAPDAEAAGEKAVRVVISFVVEKDGTLSDIKVLQNPGLGLDKEAIRVLKSMKARWEPGIMKGEKVRTIHTLPILIQPLQ